jgi:PilZ domain
MKAVISSVDPDPETTPEGRHARRDRVRLGAEASFGNGALSMECVVTDLSREGARLALPMPVLSLHRLEIAIPSRNLKCRARVVWRRRDIVGVRFDMPIAGLGGGIGEDLERLAALQAENLQLQRKVDSLTRKIRRMTDE